MFGALNVVMFKKCAKPLSTFCGETANSKHFYCHLKLKIVPIPVIFGKKRRAEKPNVASEPWDEDSLPRDATIKTKSLDFYNLYLSPGQICACILICRKC